MRNPRARVVVAGLLLAVVGLAAFAILGEPVWRRAYVRILGGRTVAEAVEQYGGSARERLRPAFEAAGVEYPPPRIALLALKEEKILELWADVGGRWVFVDDYPILGASGKAGPKLREGDKQVPEGVYRIIGLNPNSRWHLSMKLNYPNEFDLRQAEADGRENPGSDIFIHGMDQSIGCIAVGNAAIEELFVLVSDVGQEDTAVLIAPRDPRTGPLDVNIDGAPDWLPELYESIETEFRAFARDGT